MVGLALAVVLTALALMVLSGITPFLQIKDFGSLIVVSLLLALVPGILGFVFQWAGLQADGVPMVLALQFLDQAILLGLVAMFVGGVEFQGFLGFLLTVVTLVALDFATPAILAYANAPI